VSQKNIASLKVKKSLKNVENRCSISSTEEIASEDYFADTFFKVGASGPNVKKLFFFNYYKNKDNF
jgi:hypothetical protein